MVEVVLESVSVLVFVSGRRPAGSGARDAVDVSRETVPRVPLPASCSSPAEHGLEHEHGYGHELAPPPARAPAHELG